MGWSGRGNFTKSIGVKEVGREEDGRDVWQTDREGEEEGRASKERGDCGVNISCNMQQLHSLHAHTHTHTESKQHKLINQHHNEKKVQIILKNQTMKLHVHAYTL